MENSQSPTNPSPGEPPPSEGGPPAPAATGPLAGQVFYQLMATIVQRRDHPSPDSYTCKLLEGGDTKIGSKIVEEAAEVIDAAIQWSARKNGLINTDAPLDQIKQGTESHLVYESADLIYHLMVLLAHHRIDLQAVESELGRRFGLSGLEEKASRSRKS